MHKLIVSIILLVLTVMVVPRGYTEIVEDGLVGYWSFDQIVGKTVKDGLKKHDGAISKGNIKSANNGKIGKALLFDGEPDFVEIDGANDFIANADISDELAGGVESATMYVSTDNQSTWQTIADTSRACGAFPFAFSPVALFRRFEELDYQGRGAEDFSSVKPDGKFTYIDGGAFNNYPLGMAREIAKSNDNDPLDYAKRFYFYISPSAKASTMDLTLDAESPDFNMMSVASSAAKGIFAQSRFQDWLMTDKINHKVELLDERAKQIVDIVTSSTKTAVKRLAQTSKELCLEIYKDTTDNDEQLNDAIARLTLQYKEDFANYDNATQEEKDAWIYSIALLEKSAGLNDFDIMNVYTITAKPEDLASEKVMSFMGFFEERFRHHDYMRGRLNATNVILHILESRQNAQKAKDHLPLNVDSAFYKAQKKALEDILNDTKLGNVTPRNAAIAARERVYERVKDRYYALAKQMGMNWVLRVGLYNFYIKKRLRGYLEL